MIPGHEAPEAANENADMAPDVMNARYETVNDVMRILSNPVELEDLYSEVSAANDNEAEALDIAA